MDNLFKCAVCGNIISQTEKSSNNIMANTIGAKLYYDLWHFSIDRCHNCNYASRDITIVEDKNIVYSKFIKEILENSILKELNNARPNLVSDYLLAGEYYDFIHDDLNKSLCLIQAGDLVYEELIYWREYILDEEDVDDVIRIKSFAEEIYNQGIVSLKSYLTNHPDDIDRQLLLIGVLNEGSKADRLESNALIKSIRNKNLSETQKLILEFLEANRRA